MISDKRSAEAVGLGVKIGPLELKNPVMTASGTFGYGLEFEPFVDLSRLGAVVVKGLSLEPRPGNPPPRIVETAGGMLNAIGLQNIGIRVFIQEKMPLLRQLGVTVIANIFGETIDEYRRVAAMLDPVAGIAGMEVNISCPNVKKGGIAFGAGAATALTRLEPNTAPMPVRPLECLRSLMTQAYRTSFSPAGPVRIAEIPPCRASRAS